MHGRYSVLAHYLKVSLKNSRFLKIPKLHSQMMRVFLLNIRLILKQSLVLINNLSNQHLAIYILMQAIISPFWIKDFLILCIEIWLQVNEVPLLSDKFVYGSHLGMPARVSRCLEGQQDIIRI